MKRCALFTLCDIVTMGPTTIYVHHATSFPSDQAQIYSRRLLL